MAADIFGQRIGDDVRAVVQRALPQRAEEGVVDRNRAAPVECRVARVLDCFYVDQGIGRIAGAFEVNHADLAAAFARHRLGLVQHGVDLFARGACREVDIFHAELAQPFGDEAFGCGVERAGMHDDIALRRIGEHQDADRSHAAGEAQRVFRTVPDGEAVFQDLLVGRVEARIDEAVCAARTLAGDAFEVALAVGGAGEGESGSEEDGRLQAAFRQSRIEAISHHQRAGFQLAALDLGDLRVWVSCAGWWGRFRYRS